MVGSGPAAVLAVVECLSRPRFRVSASRGRAAGVSLGLNLNHGQDTRANRTRRWVWMVVRFVCVLRVSACALVCPVCVPAPPGVFLPVSRVSPFSKTGQVSVRRAVNRHENPSQGVTAATSRMMTGSNVDNCLTHSTSAAVDAQSMWPARLASTFSGATPKSPLALCAVHSLRFLAHVSDLRGGQHPHQSQFYCIAVGRVIHPVPLRVYNWKSFALNGSIVSLTHRLQLECHALIVNMDASTPEARMAVQLDLSRLFGILSDRRQPLVLFHGSTLCQRTTRYTAVAWKMFNETCWFDDVWLRLVKRQTLHDQLCYVRHINSTEEQRWCSAWLNTSSSCSSQAPMIKVASADLAAESCTVATESCTVRERVYFDNKFTKAQIRERARYYSIIPCRSGPSDALCLLFKNEIAETWIGGLQSLDGGRSFRGPPNLVMPAFPSSLDNKRERKRYKFDLWGLNKSATLTHNYAILSHGNEYILVGGRHKKPVMYHDGLWTARGTSWRWSERNQTDLTPVYRGRGVYEPLKIATPMQWTQLRHMMDGRHPGCIEARQQIEFPYLAGPGVCEFDGRLSLAWLDGRFFLYARSNPASRGRRAVQVSTSTDMINWTPFERISLKRHTTHSDSDGDLYFFLVQGNPTQPGSLIALYPLVQHARGCIGVSLSVDGRTWSGVTPLLRCAVHGERAEHQPIAAVFSNASSAAPEVFVFVHERVPGIMYEEAVPRPQARALERLSKERGSRLVRYTVQCAVFMRWTSEQLAMLASAGTDRAARLLQVPSYRCPTANARREEGSRQ